MTTHCAAGHFELIAADSETLRHLKQFHKPPGLTAKTLQQTAQKVKLATHQLPRSHDSHLHCGIFTLSQVAIVIKAALINTASATYVEESGRPELYAVSRDSHLVGLRCAGV